MGKDDKTLDGGYVRHMTRVRKFNYVDGSKSDNSIAFVFGRVTIYFSYDTVIAYDAPDEGLVMSQSQWGPTTGRHLNAISNTVLRIDRAKFETQLNALSIALGLSFVTVSEDE